MTLFEAVSNEMNTWRHHSIGQTHANNIVIIQCIRIFINGTYNIINKNVVSNQTCAGMAGSGGFYCTKSLGVLLNYHFPVTKVKHH